MNNREYLYSLVAKPGRLDEWFEEEHVDVWDLREELEAAHAKNRSKRMHIQNMQNGRHYWHNRARKLEAEMEKAKADRTCRDVSLDRSTQFYCSECECTVEVPLLFGTLAYCPGCGRKVVD